jgi:hypothetical protein
LLKKTPILSRVLLAAAGPDLQKPFIHFGGEIASINYAHAGFLEFMPTAPLKKYSLLSAAKIARSETTVV